MSESVLTLDDAAEVLGVTRIWVNKLVKAGRLSTDGSGERVLWADVRRLASSSSRLPSMVTPEMLSNDTPPSFLGADADVGDRALLADIVGKVHHGHCLTWLRRLPDHCAQTVVTSPPYWGLRRYPGEQGVCWADGTTVAFGQEKAPEDYVRHTLEVLRELRRVLKEDGVVWWNVGDTYMTRAHVRERSRERLDALEGRRRKESWKDYPLKRYSAGHTYLKDKDLTLIPFQIALAAQHQGWWVRSVITWSKENTVPESVKDRPTSSHEYILMLTQTRFYYYNNSDAKEATISNGWAPPEVDEDQRNLRTVWSFGTSGGPNGHVAAFPLELPTRCIAAASKPGDLVIDPFAGSATTLIAARRLGRQYAGCDLAAEYVEAAGQGLEGEINGTTKDLGKNGKVFMPRLLETRSTKYEPALPPGRSDQDESVLPNQV